MARSLELALAAVTTVVRALSPLAARLDRQRHLGRHQQAKRLGNRLKIQSTHIEDVLERVRGVREQVVGVVGRDVMESSEY